MNKENLLRVADAIERHEIRGLGYNQIMWVDNDLPDNTGQGCGTTACLAGWACALALKLAPDELYEYENSNPVGYVAQQYLELDDYEAGRLFRACPLEHIDVTERDLKAHHAVSTLRYAAKHGIVDWDAANPAPVP